MALLPARPLELVSQQLIANALAARPAFLIRLGEYADFTFAIDPVDCPFTFLITPGAGRPTVRLLRDADPSQYAARIAAPLIVLLGLLDGSYDGDALFFSRDLVIEGDTEAVLALRNAIEEAELDPASVVGLPNGLKPPFNRAAGMVLAQLRHALGAPHASGAATVRPLP